MEPIAPSPMRIESVYRSLKGWIFKGGLSCSLKMCEASSAVGLHQRCVGAHQVVLGEDLEARVVHVHEDGGIFVAEDVSDALDGSGARYFRQRLAHHFADDEFTEILALQRHGQNLVFINGADGNVFLEDRDLRNV